jgi:D-beta-D-heptose 7-phosphate kinase / D-beta-D-heptose 1-phosphate adenosyltransferase
MIDALISRIENLGQPRVLVVGDLILDRYIWGYAERISQEAPVALLRADQREHRLGGASSVATMLAALGACVQIAGVVGQDDSATLVRHILNSQGIDDSLVLAVSDRPTTVKERYIGRAQDRHPQQMIRVDYEVRDAIATDIEEEFINRLDQAIASSDIILISDYDKGVCTPRLLRQLIDKARAAGKRVLADPIRGSDYSRYRGVHCMTPNRLEAGLATGLTIRTNDEAMIAAEKLKTELNMEASIVTLDRDGMALIDPQGQQAIHPTRQRQVYDITGAGDMVLSVIGLVLAAGGDYAEAVALGNVAGGLEVEKIGVALISRQEIISDLIEHHASGVSKIKTWAATADECQRRQRAGQKVVFTNGCFDLLHVGHVRLLAQSAAAGDYLVVGLNSDASVKRLKGDSRPVNDEMSRAEVLAALGCVDAVAIFGEETPRELINTLRPDVLVKGGDYKPHEVVGRDEVESWGGRLVLIDIVAGHSTTSMIQRAGRPTDSRAAVAHTAEQFPPRPNFSGTGETARKPVNHQTN